MKIEELFSNLSYADEGARGGYARVVRAVCEPNSAFHKISPVVAIKVMRSDVDWEAGSIRFIEEIELLSSLLKNKSSLPPNISETIMELYGYGYVQSDFAVALDKREVINLNWEIIFCADLASFIHKGDELEKKSPQMWKPFLVLELANYDDSLFRQIVKMPDGDGGLYRIPTGEVIMMSIKLLDTLEYLHSQGKAYIDWKPEHVHWDGETGIVKLIDWNVTCPLSNEMGPAQNIKDDVRLFCGAILYSSLTMVDMEGKQLGAKPTTRKHLKNPIQQARMRYLPSHDLIFYKAYNYLDKPIMDIIRKGIDIDNGFSTPAVLKSALIEYAKNELGVLVDNPADPYMESLRNLRVAQKALYHAYNNMSDVIRERGTNKEFTRMRKVIVQAQDNFPLP